MRFVVYGAGAIGGVVGGRLAQAGHEVVLVARGAHADALRGRGLRLASPDGTDTLRLPVATDAAGVGFADGDVVLLAVKSQDTATAVGALDAVAAPETPIVCLQNGVVNERAALRTFANVYGVCVMCPATHLEPGVVIAHSAPVTGLFDIGRMPEGVDDTAEALAATFQSATFSSEARADIARWKYGKLLMNLANAIEALIGPEARRGAAYDHARAEAETVLTRAGIDFVGPAEDEARRGGLLTMRPVDGERHRGGSTWQSVTRGTGAVEVDYLNGEIVLLGRLVGVATPMNEVLQRQANRQARVGDPPGAVTETQLLAWAGYGAG